VVAKFGERKEMAKIHNYNSMRILELTRKEASDVCALLVAQLANVPASRPHQCRSLIPAPNGACKQSVTKKELALRWKPYTEELLYAEEVAERDQKQWL
jgi:hypothetical protein